MEHTWAWSNEYRKKIMEQISRLGCSCDLPGKPSPWTIMSPGGPPGIRYFIPEGLIYKGNRIINWCPKCMTAISDSEMEYEETRGHFWHIKYPLADGSGFVEIATTRPETMLGTPWR